jgi:hypothetical protein
MKAGGGGGQTHDIVILDAIGLTPRAHHPRIIERDHRDNIHALGLDGLEVLNIAGEVAGGAAGSEGACRRGCVSIRVCVARPSGTRRRP